MIGSVLTPSLGTETTLALAAARSSKQCSTSGRTVYQLIASVDRQEDNFAKLPALRKASRGSKLVCHAATLTKQPLSTYRWPRRRPTVWEWLDSCVQDAVRQLDQAPFVQLVYAERAERIETHHVPRTATGAAELWQAVAQLLSNNKPDAVVLVHRLPSFATEHACASQRSGSAENVLTGLSLHKAINQKLLQHDISTRNRDILAGKVGECCDDEHALNQILPFSRQHPDPLPGTRSSAHVHESEHTMDHWGLVVQSKYTSEAEGCYVLKTVRNTNPIGCQCTHYSLTRLCSKNPTKCMAG
ncbi:hypothetical protein ABBQ32_001738 [Trebouxia sp. C0010 RCD-2024]